MRRNVTAGVDGSAAALAACEWAAREAERRGASLRLVHAVTPLPGRTTVTTPTDPAPRPRTASRAPLEAESRIRTQFPDLSVVADEVAGRPVDALVAIAADTEMVVLGSHGAGTVRGALLGSVGRGVAGRAPCPVVLVPTEAETKEPSTTQGAEDATRYRDVVLGLDPDRTGGRAIGFAFEEADVSGQNLRVVHSRGARAEEALAEEDALITELEPWQAKYPSVNVIGEETVGGAASHLTAAAATASLVVLGRSTRHGTDRLGSVAQAVLHSGAAPVAVVPDGNSRSVR